MQDLNKDIVKSGTNPVDPHSVYDYKINWAVQTGTNEITVQIEARYCPACNPNPNGAPGCLTTFDNYAPDQYRSCTTGSPNGRYAAVRIKDSSGNDLGVQKFICTPTNWPLNVIHAENFIFTGISLNPGNTVKVDADFYCSFCGHWYPTPVDVVVQSSNTVTTYTGDISAWAGDTANLSAVLTDGTNNPLQGKTITFKLDSLATVSATTDSTGVAVATLLIPDTMAAGIYVMDTKFAGDAQYYPSSDVDNFEVKAPTRGVIF